MIIGAMKAGTTDLSSKIAAHSGVSFCRTKEPHFFAKNPAWEGQLDRYHSLFRPEPGQICGEGSVSYSFVVEDPDVVDRLYRYNPDLRLVFIVRDPIDRIRSHYTHRLMGGIADLDPRREISIRRGEYIGRSRYGRTLEAYQDTFGPERILTLMFDDYVRDPDGTVASALEFLGLPEEDLSQASARNRTTGSNRSPWSPVFYLDQLLSFSPPAARRFLGRWINVKLRHKPTLPREIASDLWAELESDMDLFERISGHDLSGWRSRWTAPGGGAA
jgi:hypothetical protein